MNDVEYRFHANLFASPFACTWEAAAASLRELPRMIFEPDGSFVTSGGVGAERWQVDGHLFDFDGRLHRVELHGFCPPAALDQLLRCIGWPEVTLQFEMVREGVTLSEAEFRQAAAAVGDDPARTIANTPKRAESSPTPIPVPTSTSVPTSSPNRTTWHITFGTYGTRLHGDSRPTVDKQQNRLGESFIAPDPARQQAAQDRMKRSPITFTISQREFIEQHLPEICLRGGWQLRTCAAAADHVHLLCDIPTDIPGEKVRRLIKRWLTQGLNKRWPLPKDARWWATEGSNKAIHNDAYRKNAFVYIERQRTLR